MVGLLLYYFPPLPRVEAFMRTSKLLLRACSVSSFALLLLAGVPLHAQAVNDGNTTGFPPFGSFHGSDFDLVSLQNGNLHIEIPVASTPQRAGGVFNYRFVYDSPTYEINRYYATPTSPAAWLVRPDPGETAKVRLDSPAAVSVNYEISQKRCNSSSGPVTYF